MSFAFPRNEVDFNQLKYALGPVNGGFGYTSFQQGSSGMMSGQPIISNENYYVRMKHGSHTVSPYSGIPKDGILIKNYGHYKNCEETTLDPIGCQYIYNNY